MEHCTTCASEFWIWVTLNVCWNPSVGSGARRMRYKLSEQKWNYTPVPFIILFNVPFSKQMRLRFQNMGMYWRHILLIKITFIYSQKRETYGISCTSFPFLNKYVQFFYTRWTRVLCLGKLFCKNSVAFPLIKTVLEIERKNPIL